MQTYNHSDDLPLTSGEAGEIHYATLQDHPDTKETSQ